VLERLTNELDCALNDVGMKINSGKCKWLAYLPRTVNYQALTLPSSMAINHAGQFIENVEEFKYLGFLTTFDLAHRNQVHARTVLMRLAARFSGRLLRSLQVTNFRGLRSYFYSLVGSQLYSLSVINFPELEYDRSIKLFLQECFSLPASFPMSIAKFFLRIDDLILQAFNARVNFFRRIISGSNSDASLGAMYMNRTQLFHRGMGWNADFVRITGGLLDFSELDLSNAAEIEEARSELVLVLARRRRERFAASASAFVVELFPNLMISPSFTQHLADLPHESVRIVLIFFANLFQYTYLRSSNLICAFCQGELSSTHLFMCQGVIQNSLCDWNAFVYDFQNENFADALDRLFLILQRWTTLTNRFQPSLSAHVDEYFTSSDFQNRRRDPRWFILPSMHS
jgi:hypothetical protein